MQKSLNVLIIDDEAVVREMLAGFVTELGHGVAGLAGCIEEARTIFVTTHPDVLLVDIGLGRESGFDLIRSLYDIRPCPTVILSGRDSQDFINQAAEFNIANYIVKPFTSRELDRAILLAWARFEDLRLLREQNARLEDELMIRRSLEERLILFEIAVEQSPNMVIITDDLGSIEYVNPKFTDITGYTFSEVRGRNPRILNSGAGDKAVFADLWERIGKGADWKGEFVNRKKNGELYWEEALISPMVDMDGSIRHYLKLAQDITDRKHRERELREQLDFIQELVDTSPNPIFAKDENQRYVMCNKALMEFLNLSRDEIIGKSLAEIGRQPEPEIIEDIDRQLLSTGGITSYEMQAVDRSGQSRDLMVHKGVYVLTETRQKGIIAIATDITHLKQTEQKLLDSERKLLAALSTRDRLFSILAHDLRGPIGNIVTSLDLLNSGGIDEKTRSELLPDLLDAGRQTYDLLQNLLNWARGQSNTIEFSPTKIDLRRIVLQCMDLFTHLAKAKTITIIEDIQEPLIAFADAEMITTVVRNLLSNAVKFTPPRGEISVSGGKTPKEVWIRVSDTGVGMNPIEISRLFDIEERFSKTGTNREKGSGLGLILCYDFLAKNSGKIKAESAPGKGSVFTVSLPVKPW